MSKRPHVETASDAPGMPEGVGGSNNGLVSINELLSPSEEPEPHETHAKKPRNFIATVVPIPVNRRQAHADR
jgi:hypothetical protein